MAEVLVEYTDRIMGPDGASYVARACGRQMDDRDLWEAWLEFIDSEGHLRRSGRETTQPNRTDALYWATGLTPVYLEGALVRALGDAPGRPTGPAGRESGGSPPRTRREPILDPFAVAEHGEAHLRSQLLALSERHLVDIAVAYDLADAPEAELERLARTDLAAIIASAVAARQGRNP